METTTSKCDRNNLRLLLLGLTVLLCSPAFAIPHPDAEKANLSANNLVLSPSGASLFSTGQAAPLEHLEVSSAVSLHYLNQPLLVRNKTTNEISRYLLNHREALHLHAALGFQRYFHLGATFPVVLNQQGRFPGLQTGPVTEKGIGDLTLMLQGGAPKDPDARLSLGFQLPLSFPTGDETAYMSSGELSAEPRLIATAHHENIHVSSALGYRIVSENTLFDYTEDDRITYRLNARYGNPDAKWQAELELLGGFSAAAPFADPSQSPGELLAGARYQFSDTLSVFLGAGVGLSAGLPAPTFRVLSGITLKNRDNVDQDFDTIPLINDQCPEDPEDFDNFMDEDGCPDYDNDKDRILDPDDTCPNDPEDLDQFEDSDGCPDPDNDQDKVLDKDDRCPDEPEDQDGFEDEDGCAEIDNDDDGILDEQDQCPNDPEDKDGFGDEDGCPETDNDQDGVEDEIDQCPDAPEDQDGFEDEDGCPEEDNDQDGILDEQDQCPDEPEVINNYQDEDGCPDEGEEEEVVEIEDGELNVNVDGIVFFDTGRAFLKRPARPVLNQLVSLMKNHQRIELLHISGHTDSRGNPEFNRRLSKKRAMAVQRYLLKRGVAPSRVKIIGHGEDRPQASNTSRKGRKQNRRVQFTIEKWAAPAGASPQKEPTEAP